jgi:UDP-glucose 4-epimerase
MIKKEKILVIGGAGYVGSNLIRRIATNNEVISIDCYYTGKIENHIDGVKYIKGNSRDIENLIPNDNFDYIFHFGEYSRVETSFDDYKDVMRLNIESFSSVVEYAKNHSKKIIYSGSSTKFGDITGGKEASPYAWSKKVNTEHLLRYANWFGINFCIVYFYNIYGKNEIANGRHSTLIGKYTELVKNGAETLPVVMPGTQVRNFTHIDDVINALILIAKNGNGDGYGIGSKNAYTILDVVKMFGKKAEYLPKRRGNRMSAELKIEKTLALGWSPEHDLKTYIKSILK